jgi:hypothetical protein
MEVVIVDVARTQSYIFGSNRLQENIGASYLVDCATEKWVLDLTRSICASCNVNSDDTLDPDKRLTGPSPTAGLEAEVLYTGGGNALVLFQATEKASQLVRQLSRRVLQRGPGLRVNFGRYRFNPAYNRIEDTDIWEGIQKAFQDLERCKGSGPVYSPLLGLGVTLECQSTGLPAVRVVPAGGADVYPASSETLAKVVAVDGAEDRLKNFFGNPAYQFPVQFDQLGRDRGEQSYLAVVHLDGNDVGSRFQGIRPEVGQDYVARRRALSEGIKSASQSALKKTLDHLWSKVQDSNKDGKSHKVVPHPKLPWLRVTLPEPQCAPVRPLVYGGDDITFVCDGRLGLALATRYMSKFEQETRRLLQKLGGMVTCCAGIAIVKAHYPFSQAYVLAEALCQEAKSYRRDNEQLQQSSCLDWHLATSGLTGNISYIRKREYWSTDRHPLNLRPLTLGANPQQPVRAWEVVRAVLDEFQGEEWSGKRNKAKALRDTLRNGATAVEAFLTRYNRGKPLPAPASVAMALDDFKRTGWHGNRCAYFDALEMADWFIPLDLQEDYGSPVEN